MEHPSRHMGKRRKSSLVLGNGVLPAVCLCRAIIYVVCACRYVGTCRNWYEDINDRAPLWYKNGRKNEPNPASVINVWPPGTKTWKKASRASDTFF